MEKEIQPLSELVLGAREDSISSRSKRECCVRRSLMRKDLLLIFSAKPIYYLFIHLKSHQVKIDSNFRIFSIP